MNLWNLLARVVVEVVKAVAVVYVAGRANVSPEELAEALKKSRGTNRSFLQRVPKEGARS